MYKNITFIWIEDQKVEILIIHYTIRKLYYLWVIMTSNLPSIFFSLSPPLLPFLSSSPSLPPPSIRTFIDHECLRVLMRKGTESQILKGWLYFFPDLTLHYLIICACKIEWENKFYLKLINCMSFNLNVQIIWFNNYYMHVKMEL